MAPPFPAGKSRLCYLHMPGSQSQLEMFDLNTTLQTGPDRSPSQSMLEGKKFAFLGEHLSFWGSGGI